MARKSLTPTGLVPLASDPSGTRAGDAYFNTTLGVVRVYNGTIWTSVGGGSDPPTRITSGQTRTVAADTQMNTMIPIHVNVGGCLKVAVNGVHYSGKH